MTTFADADLLHVWETMRHRSLPRRTAALLALVMPEPDSQQPADLSLTEASRHLLGWRCGRSGPQLACVADCQDCGASFEFELDAQALEQSLLGEPKPASATPWEHEGYRVEFRAPTIGDCVAAADFSDAGSVYQSLLQRCVSGIGPDGAALHVETLPDGALQALEEHLQSTDAATALQLSLACPSCQQLHATPLDVAAFCWAEIDAQMPRLLDEVHLLATRYGWRETDILAMGGTRRSHYLERVLS
jgi:hypothetical protein